MSHFQFSVKSFLAPASFRLFLRPSATMTVRALFLRVNAVSVVPDEEVALRLFLQAFLLSLSTLTPHFRLFFFAYMSHGG